MDQALRYYLSLAVPTSHKAIEIGLRQALQPVGKKYGLTKLQSAYVMALSKGDMTLTELSEYLAFNKSNTTRAVSYLIAHGFVSKNEKDVCRGFTVSLTAKGRQTVAEVDAVFNTFMDRCIADIPDDRVRICLDVMEQVCINVDPSNREVFASIKALIDLPTQETEPTRRRYPRPTYHD